MTINENLMNIAPLHTSKDFWYCNKPTAHPSCVGMPIVKNGHFDFLLTAKGTLPASADTKSSTFTFAGDFAVCSGLYRGAMTSDGCITLELDHDNRVVITPRVDGGYNMEFTLRGGVYTGRVRMSADDITSPSGHYTVMFDTTTARFDFTAISVDYNGAHSMFLELRTLETDALLETLEVRVEVELVPEKYRTTERVAWISLIGDFVHNYADGAYYLKVFYTDGNTRREYYSEPFQYVTDMSQYVRINYRRTQPVITTENYIPFIDERGVDVWLTMFVKSNILAPPFSFNAEVTETDGRKFTEKQVSYRSDKFSFLCTAYFVEAVRLLWHCDKRVVAQPQMLYEKSVDYMELPEVSWNSDNHFCDVSLTFQSDTVVQTNGLATERRGYIPNTHEAFDNSYDNSYN